MKTVEEKIASIVLLCAALYFVGHAVVAWINGAFQAVMK